MNNKIDFQEIQTYWQNRPGVSTEELQILSNKEKTLETLGLCRTKESCVEIETKKIEKLTRKTYKIRHLAKCVGIACVGIVMFSIFGKLHHKAYISNQAELAVIENQDKKIDQISNIANASLLSDEIKAQRIKEIWSNPYSQTLKLVENKKVTEYKYSEITTDSAKKALLKHIETLYEYNGINIDLLTYNIYPGSPHKITIRGYEMKPDIEINKQLKKYLDSLSGVVVEQSGDYFIKITFVN